MNDLVVEDLTITFGRRRSLALADFAGDVVQITVVDVGSPESLAFFWGCAPIGQTPLVERLNRTAAALRAD